MYTHLGGKGTQRPLFIVPLKRCCSWAMIVRKVGEEQILDCTTVNKVGYDMKQMDKSNSS